MYCMQPQANARKLQGLTVDKRSIDIPKNRLMLTNSSLMRAGRCMVTKLPITLIV